MASKSKKKKKDKQPSVPNYQNINTGDLKQPSEANRPEYEPMSLNDFSNWTNKAYQLQLQYAPHIAEAQRQAQTLLYNNMAGLQQAQAPNYANVANNLLQQYSPEFRANYSALGNKVNAGLATAGRPQGATESLIDKNIYGDLLAGRNLGEGLSGEIEQGIRGAQMARGNWLGPAPTAQEAFGKGQAAEELYNRRLANAQNWSGYLENQRNTRVGQSQNYLQGRNPMDMMGQISGNFMGQQYYPAQSYVDTGMGASAMANAGSQAQQFNSTAMQGYGIFQNAQQDYNRNYIGATSANNEAMFGQYDRTADAWMYREAARNGLYSTPGVGGGGGMGGGGAMGMVGAAGSAVGTGMMGLAASGVIGTGATAAGVGIAGAAAGAAAALCWLARKLIPGQWKQFRKWLFTKAPDEVRRDYIYNARRLANLIP